MGTAAYLAVTSSPGRIFSTIIGMTYDGFPNNLQHVAARYLQLREPSLTHEQVVDSLTSEQPSWLFSDIKGNESWVSYHAILDPESRRLEIFDTINEHQISVQNIP